MSTKSCIACAETIQAEAKLCRFCNTLQNDRRFFAPQANPYQGGVPEARKAANSNLNHIEEKLCNKCSKYVVESDFYDSCDVCRGVLATGKLPVIADSDGDVDGTQEQVAVDSNVWYQSAPLGPTPGIAIAALIFAFFIPVLGLILGYTARKEIRNPAAPLGGDGLATGAIVLGWISSTVGFIWLVAVFSAANACTGYYC